MMPLPKSFKLGKGLKHIAYSWWILSMGYQYITTIKKQITVLSIYWVQNERQIICLPQKFTGDMLIFGLRMFTKLCKACVTTNLVTSLGGCTHGTWRTMPTPPCTCRRLCLIYLVVTAVLQREIVSLYSCMQFLCANGSEVFAIWEARITSYEIFVSKMLWHGGDYRQYSPLSFQNYETP